MISSPPTNTTDSDEELFPWIDELSPSHWHLAESVVHEIRSRVFTKTGLTASAGIAPNMMLAKVASDMNKPNGQYMVEPNREGVLAFVRQLPIRKVGTGKLTCYQLDSNLLWVVFVQRNLTLPGHWS